MGIPIDKDRPVGCLNEGQRRRKVVGVKEREDVKNNMRRKLLIWLKINIKWNLE